LLLLSLLPLLLKVLIEQEKKFKLLNLDAAKKTQS